MCDTSSSGLCQNQTEKWICNVMPMPYDRQTHLSSKRKNGPVSLLSQMRVVSSWQKCSETPVNFRPVRPFLNNWSWWFFFAFSGNQASKGTASAFGRVHLCVLAKWSVFLLQGRIHRTGPLILNPLISPPVLKDEIWLQLGSPKSWIRLCVLDCCENNLNLLVQQKLLLLLRPV